MGIASMVSSGGNIWVKSLSHPLVYRDSHDVFSIVFSKKKPWCTIIDYTYIIYINILIIHIP